MNPLVEQFKNKVDEIIECKNNLKSETQKFKTQKKDDLTIGEYKKQASKLASQKKEIETKIYKLNFLPAMRVARKFGGEDFMLNSIFQESQSFEETTLYFGLDKFKHSDIIQALFNRLTGKKFNEKILKSKYFRFEYEHGDEYVFPTEFEALIAQAETNGKLSQEQIVDMINNRTCVLLSNEELYATKSKDHPVKNILSNYMFELDLLDEKPTVYDKLYPALRSTLWTMIDEDFTKTLNNMVNGYQKQISKAEKGLKEYTKKATNNQAVIKAIANGDADAIKNFKNDFNEDEQDEENY